MNWETKESEKVKKIKENQKMKFGQLIKSYMRHIFLKKSYPKSSGETSIRLFP